MTLLAAVELPGAPELALRLVAAAVLGAIVGLERELYDHPAGLRTHMSVALGSALFAVVSAYGFDSFDVRREETVLQADVTRIASNIVTGVGFLGGGAILKHGVSVRGLTTAASLWVTAAVGLAVGLGSYLVAAVATAVLLVALVGLRAPSRYVQRRWSLRQDIVVVTLEPGAPLQPVLDALRASPDRHVAQLDIAHEAGRTVLQVELRTSSVHSIDEVLTLLAGADGVERVATGST